MLLCRQWENICTIIKLRATQSLSLWFSCTLAVLDLLNTKIVNILEKSKVFKVSFKILYKITKFFPGISFTL